MWLSYSSFYSLYLIYFPLALPDQLSSISPVEEETIFQSATQWGWLYVYFSFSDCSWDKTFNC